MVLVLFFPLSPNGPMAELQHPQVLELLRPGRFTTPEILQLGRGVASEVELSELLPESSYHALLLNLLLASCLGRLTFLCPHVTDSHASKMPASHTDYIKKPLPSSGLLLHGSNHVEPFIQRPLYTDT